MDNTGTSFLVKKDLTAKGCDEMQKNKYLTTHLIRVTGSLELEVLKKRRTGQREGCQVF